MIEKSSRNSSGSPAHFIRGRSFSSSTLSPPYFSLHVEHVHTSYRYISRRVAAADTANAARKRRLRSSETHAAAVLRDTGQIWIINRINMNNFQRCTSGNFNLNSIDIRDNTMKTSNLIASYRWNNYRLSFNRCNLRLVEEYLGMIWNNDTMDFIDSNFSDEEPRVSRFFKRYFHSTRIRIGKGAKYKARVSTRNGSKKKKRKRKKNTAERTKVWLRVYDWKKPLVFRVEIIRTACG